MDGSLINPSGTGEPVIIGARLGAYEIVVSLGAGGIRA
jgi:hypothetical protein